jgi:hypothetical protein
LGIAEASLAISGLFGTALIVIGWSEIQKKRLENFCRETMHDWLSLRATKISAIIHTSVYCENNHKLFTCQGILHKFYVEQHYDVMTSFVFVLVRSDIYFV